MEKRSKNGWTCICGLLQILGGMIGLGRLLLLNFTRAAAHFCITIFGLFLVGIPMLVELLAETAGEFVTLLLINQSIALNVLSTLGMAILVINFILTFVDGIYLIVKGLKKSSKLLSLLGTIVTYIVLFGAIYGTLITVINYELTVALFTGETVSFYESRDNLWTGSYVVEDDYLIYTGVSTEDLDMFIFTISDGENMFVSGISDVKSGVEFTVKLKISKSDFESGDYLTDTLALNYKNQTKGLE